jgi:hypothetical protein
MPIQLNSPGWRIGRARASGGATRDVGVGLPGLPSEFLTDESRVAEEVVLDPRLSTNTAITRLVQKRTQLRLS